MRNTRKPISLEVHQRYNTCCVLGTCSQVCSKKTANSTTEKKQHTHFIDKFVMWCGVRSEICLERRFSSSDLRKKRGNFGVLTMFVLASRGCVLVLVVLSISFLCSDATLHVDTIGNISFVVWSLPFSNDTVEMVPSSSNTSGKYGFLSASLSLTQSSQRSDSQVLRALVDQGAVGIIVCDRSGTSIRINPKHDASPSACFLGVKHGNEPLLPFLR